MPLKTPKQNVSLSLPSSKSTEVVFFFWNTHRKKTLGVISILLALAGWFGKDLLFSRIFPGHEPLVQVPITLNEFLVEPRVLGATDTTPLATENDDTSGLFIETDWVFEKGLVMVDGGICSKGRSDKPILFAAFKNGLLVGHGISARVSVYEYDRIKVRPQEPKVILSYDGKELFLPGPDIQYANFDDKRKAEQAQKPNKLAQPVDVSKPIGLLFEPKRLIGNKIAYTFSLAYSSTDPEIPDVVTSPGSFETYQNQVGSGPYPLAFGLYAGTCIKIHTFTLNPASQ